MPTAPQWAEPCVLVLAIKWRGSGDMLTINGRLRLSKDSHYKRCQKRSRYRIENAIEMLPYERLPCRDVDNPSPTSRFETPYITSAIPEPISSLLLRSKNHLDPNKHIQALYPPLFLAQQPLRPLIISTTARLTQRCTLLSYSLHRTLYQRLRSVSRSLC